MNPAVLVLDEPTSALDPAAAEEALAAILRLVHDLGVTAILAEHRLERVCEYADRLVVVDGADVTQGLPAQLLRTSRIAPPVVELGRLAGWDPLPLSVRDARRRAAPLRERLAGRAPEPATATPGSPADGLVAQQVVVRHGTTVAVNAVDLAVAPGEVVALMGRNGSGKSSLLWALQGAGTRTSGTGAPRRPRPARAQPQGARRLVALVRSRPPTCSTTTASTRVRRRRQSPPTRGPAPRGAGSTRSRAPTPSPAAATRETCPRGSGWRWRSPSSSQPALAYCSWTSRPAAGLHRQAAPGRAARPRWLQTARAARGDPRRRVRRPGRLAGRRARRGRHDHRRTVEAAIASSPVFAPQVAKVLSPQRWLTVEQVRDALGVSEAVTRV
jgi:energy-coupling factor transport system ATP-binding protein